MSLERFHLDADRSRNIHHLSILFLYKFLGVNFLVAHHVTHVVPFMGHGAHRAEQLVLGSKQVDILYDFLRRLIHLVFSPFLNSQISICFISFNGAVLTLLEG